MAPTVAAEASLRWLAWCDANGLHSDDRAEGLACLKAQADAHAKELEVIARGVELGVFQVTSDTLESIAAAWREK